MKKFLVVGAGLTGCSIANLLSTRFPDCYIDLVERRDVVGGNCADGKEVHDKKQNLISGDILIHKYGPHIFHTNNQEVWDFLSKFTQWHYYFCKAMVSVHAKEVNMPFNLNSLYDLFPMEYAKKLERLLLENYEFGTSVPIIDFVNGENQDLKFLANFIFDNVFKNYVVKQWGTDASLLDPAVMRRVPINISRDDCYFKDKFQAIPLHGYSKMIENMVECPNINVHLGKTLKEFSNCSNYIELLDFIKNQYDHVFVTSSIDEFFDYKFGVLPYRSLSFDYQKYQVKDYQSAVVVSYPNNYDFTRITEHKKFLRYDDNLPYTIIGIEYSSPFKEGVNERFYPIFNEENQSLYNKYLGIDFNHDLISFTGRLGSYKYLNMDQAVELAFSVFKNYLRE